MSIAMTPKPQSLMSIFAEFEKGFSAEAKLIDECQKLINDLVIKNEILVKNIRKPTFWERLFFSKSYYERVKTADQIFIYVEALNKNIPVMIATLNERLVRLNAVVKGSDSSFSIKDLEYLSSGVSKEQQLRAEKIKIFGEAIQKELDAAQQFLVCKT